MVLGRVHRLAILGPDEETLVVDFNAVVLALLGVEVGDLLLVEARARALLEVEVLAVAFVEPLVDE